MNNTLVTQGRITQFAKLVIVMNPASGALVFILFARLLGVKGVRGMHHGTCAKYASQYYIRGFYKYER